VLDGELGLGDQAVEEHGLLVLGGGDTQTEGQAQRFAVDGDLRVLEAGPDAVRHQPGAVQFGVGQHQQVAVVPHRAHQVRGAGAFLHHVHQGLAGDPPEVGAVEVDELGQPVHLQQHTGDGDLVAARLGELALHQVQDLRLGEQGRADEASAVVLGASAARGGGPALAKSRLRHDGCGAACTVLRSS